jgi:hypothetical protein
MLLHRRDERTCWQHELSREARLVAHVTTAVEREDEAANPARVTIGNPLVPLSSK